MASNRGNQASGTERPRPSLSSTVSVSFVTVTDPTAGVIVSIAKVFKPRLTFAGKGYDCLIESGRMLSQYRVCLSSPVLRSAPSSTRPCKSLVAVALEVFVIFR